MTTEEIKCFFDDSRHDVQSYDDDEEIIEKLLDSEEEFEF